jgi:hypothetical protein
LLIAGLTIRDEAHVNKRLELNVGGGLEGVKVKLEWMWVALASNLDHIVEITLRVALKLNIKFYGQTGSNVSNVFVVATEV